MTRRKLFHLLAGLPLVGRLVKPQPSGPFAPENLAVLWRVYLDAPNRIDCVGLVHCSQDINNVDWDGFDAT